MAQPTITETITTLYNKINTAYSGKTILVTPQNVDSATTTVKSLLASYNYAIAINQVTTRRIYSNINGNAYRTFVIDVNIYYDISGYTDDINSLITAIEAIIVGTKTNGFYPNWVLGDTTHEKGQITIECEHQYIV